MMSIIDTMWWDRITTGDLTHRGQTATYTASTCSLTSSRRSGWTQQHRWCAEQQCRNNLHQMDVGHAVVNLGSRALHSYQEVRSR
jgi:hypothetical protein